MSESNSLTSLSVPPQIERHTVIEGRIRMTERKYLATLKKFKDFLKKKAEQKDDKKKKRVKVTENNYCDSRFDKQEDSSSSEEEPLNSEEILWQTEIYKKMRGKVLVELYKQLDETTHVREAGHLVHRLGYQRNDEGDTVQ